VGIGRRKVVWVGLFVAALMAWDLGSALGVRGRPADPEASAATLPSTGPLFILVLGSDARPGTAVVRGRSDVMLIVGVNRARKRATILGLNRDTWVSIPGHDDNRINAAMAYGGPALAVQTVRKVTGIPIDAWMVTSFRGFARMVNAVAGVLVDVPYPMFDPFSRAAFEPGWQRLDGTDSLSFVRDRHGVPSSVVSRTMNQGNFTRNAWRQYEAEYRRRHERLRDWVRAGTDHLQTNLSMRQILSLAALATRIPTTRVNVVVTPGRVGMVGAAEVVFLTEASHRVFADLADDGIIG